MKFIIAPDSYKESLSALEVAKAIEQGVKKVFPQSETLCLPIADGGEGTLDAIKQNIPTSKTMTLDVMQANGVQAPASYLLLDDNTAVIEIAQSSGLQQIPKSERNPFLATSYGTGQLMQHALQQQVTNFIIALGGSACNDAGAGLLQALGIKFLDDKQKEIPVGNSGLAEIATIDFGTVRDTFKNINIAILTDVDNQLFGPHGATYVFGKQKGATPSDLPILDHNIKHFSQKIEAILGKTFHHIAGSGAAGGLGFALQVLNDTVTIHSGIEYILDLIHFENYLPNTTLVLTGEGGTDFQTAHGKAPIGVVKKAQKYNIPTIIISGKVEGDLSELYDAGVVSAHSVLHTISTLEDALQNAKSNITYTTEAIIRTRFL